VPAFSRGARGALAPFFPLPPFYAFKDVDTKIGVSYFTRDSVKLAILNSKYKYIIKKK